MNKYFLYTILITILLSGCQDKNRFEIDTNKNKVVVNITRFDLDLINLDTTNISRGISELEKKHPSFSKIFAKEIMGANSFSEHYAQQELIHFLRNPSVKEINSATVKSYENIANIEEELSVSFSYLHYYFPELTLPEIFTYISGFSKQIVYTDSTLGIGLDCYLGKDFELYSSHFYDYQLSKLTTEYISIDVINSILEQYFDYNWSKKRLLEKILHRGRFIFLASTFLHNKELKHFFGYNNEQWQWALDNEKNVWRTMVSKKDIFSTDKLLINQYTNEAPFTMTISQDSPPKLGYFIGFRIIQSYMKNNTKITLTELMSQTDAQLILSRSSY